MEPRDHGFGCRLSTILFTCCVIGLATGLMSCAGYTSASGGGPGGNPGGQTLTISGVGSGNITSTGGTIDWTTDMPATSQVNYGTTASYGQTAGVSNSMVTSHSATLSSLTPSTTYHYQVVSKDSSGYQVTSNDFTLTTTASNTPPTISAVAATSITSSGATITWTTDVGATSQVNYGTTASYGQSSALDSSLVTSHSVSVSGLAVSTTYHFQVVSKNGNGNQATSGDFTFTTAASNTPPTISAVTATGITSSGATITWTTNVGATSQVNYGTTASYGQSSPLNSSLVTSHSVALSGLSASTLYHYQVVSKNSSGNQATSGDFTFTTGAATPPPTISGVTLINITSSGATITWTTNVAATSQVNYGTTASYGQSSALNSSLVTSHSVTLSGLSSSTLYHYQAASKDSNGNQATSGDFTLTTLSSGGGGGGSGGSWIPGFGQQGWFQYSTNTNLTNVCPPNNFNGTSYAWADNCKNIIDAWGGAGYDQAGHRMVIWGGGHNDYPGNEVYSMNLGTSASDPNAGKMIRLNDPTTTVQSGAPGPANQGGDCNFGWLADSRGNGVWPNARHTYFGITVGNGNLYFTGGGITCLAGGNGSTMGFFNIASGAWTRIDGGATPGSGPVSGDCGTCLTGNFNDPVVYDTNNGHLYFANGAGGNTYEWDGTTSKNRITFNGWADNESRMVYDSVDNILFEYGEGDFNKTIPGTWGAWAAVGCNSTCAAAVTGISASSFDPVNDVIYFFSGSGSTVYKYAPASNTWTTINTNTNPCQPDAGQAAIYNRFQFDSAYQVGVLVNDATKQACVWWPQASQGGGSSGPVISNLGVGSITTTSAMITWTTNVGATSQVNYGTTAAYGQSTALDSNLVTSHSVVVSGLTASTLYHFQVVSKDNSGNQTASGDSTFTTASTVTPLTISAVTATSITSSAATITWTTNVIANSQVNYGTTASYGSSSSLDVTLLTSHIVVLSGLAASTSYHYQVVSADSGGNQASSGDFTFTTSGTGGQAANGWSSRISGVNVPGGGTSVVTSFDFDSTVTLPPTASCSTSPCSTYRPGAQSYYRYYKDQPNSLDTDCTIAADGCSLKFTILNGYFQGEPGSIDVNFSSDLSKTFGPGQEFYVQYRERLDAGVLGNIPNAEGMKQDITTEGDTPTAVGPDCSNSPAEIVTIQDGDASQYPVMYINCGYSGGANAFMQSGYQMMSIGGVANNNFLDQTASGCPHYSGRGTPMTDPTCWNYVPNEWMTVQKHVKVGSWNSPSSVVEVWFAHEGEPAVLVTNASDAAIPNDGSGGGAGKYGKISLSPYNTAANWNVNTAVWYDDLIVSTRRIPDPNVATPNAPDGLSLTNITSSSVTVNWRVNSQNGSAQDDTGFIVERCSARIAQCFPNPQSGFTPIATTAPGASSYVDTSVTSGGTYTYRVRATNASGNSGYTVAECFNGGSTCGGTVVVP